MPNTSCFAATVSFALVASASADVIFQDGTFANTNWGTLEVIGNGTASSMQMVAGGNPGSFRHLTNNLAAGPGALIRVFHHYGASQATRYDPATMGAITSLDFSVDFEPISGPTGGQGVAIAFKQAQVVYFASPLAIGNNPVWQTHSGTGLIAANFVRADGLPGVPDFSAAGAPIRFGLVTYNSANGAGTPFTTEAGYDNFFVRVVPTPSAATVVGLAGLSGLRRRRAREARA